MIIHPNRYHKINPALIQQVIGGKAAAGFPKPVGAWLINEGSGTDFLDSVAGNNLNSTFTPIWEATPAAGLAAPYMVVTGNQTQPWETSSGTPFNFSGTSTFSVSVWLLLNNVNFYSEIVGNPEASPSFAGWELDTEQIASGLLSFYIASNITSGQYINVSIPASDVPTAMRSGLPSLLMSAATTPMGKLPPGNDCTALLT